jgi:hypothetical protein
MSSALPDLSELAAVAAYAPHLAQAFASLACDLALVLDGQGVVTQIALNPGSQLAPFTAAWQGLALADTVTTETRHKILSLLKDVADSGLARRREVNLPPLNPGQGADIPMAYTALRLGPTGPTLAVGHDLRAVAQMQQRFMRVQQELERGYGLALRSAAPGTGTATNAPRFELGAAPAAEAADPLNEASRAAFAAWLLAEQMAAETTAPKPPRGTRSPGGRRR